MVWAKWTHLGSCKGPKIVLVLVSNLPRYLALHAFRVFSEYMQIHSVYSQCTNRFIPRILNTQTDSYLVLVNLHSEYSQQNSIWRFTLFRVCIIHIRTDSFRIFPVYKQIYSAYSQCTYRFISRIRRMHPNNVEYSGWNIFFATFNGTLPQETVCTCATGP